MPKKKTIKKKAQKSGKSRKSHESKTAAQRRPVRRAAKSPGRPARPARKLAPLAISSQHIDYLTYKSSQLQKFYGELLELPTEYRDMDGLDYLVVRTSSTSSLGFMPPHPEMREGGATPREPGLYFMVGDVDRAYEQLLAKGFRFTRPPETMPWGHRVLTTTDPEGRTVMLATEVEVED
jgi:predicted enzyme related to lactoylglutathione lyase